MSTIIRQLHRLERQRHAGVSMARMRNNPMKTHQLINADSGNVEIYTPSNIIEAARRTLGGIDLDPASSATANERVKAKKYFSANTLARTWAGRVWMNHPFSRDYNALWICKLASEYRIENVSAACCICFASTSEK